MDPEISSILEKYNIGKIMEVTSIRETSYNRVYKILTDVGVYVLRIGTATTENDVLFECELLEKLEHENFPAPRVITTKENLPYLEAPKGMVVLFTYINGVHIDISNVNLPSENQVRLVGKILAKFHDTTANFSSSVRKTRTLESELDRVIERKDDFLAKYEDADIFIKKIYGALDFIKKSTETKGVLHNDLRPHNVFFDLGRSDIVGVIDYDWACVGQRIKDVAHTALEWSYPDGSKIPDMALFNALVDTYNESSKTEKIKIDANFYRWVSVAALADAATYFVDRIDMVESSEKRKLGSYMYGKAKHFEMLADSPIGL